MIVQTLGGARICIDGTYVLQAQFVDVFPDSLRITLNPGQQGFTVTAGQHRIAVEVNNANITFMTFFDGPIEWRESSLGGRSCLNAEISSTMQSSPV